MQEIQSLLPLARSEAMQWLAGSQAATLEPLKTTLLLLPSNRVENESDGFCDLECLSKPSFWLMLNKNKK